MDAIDKSLLLESTVRERVKPLFYTRLRLGEFDPPSMNPYTQLNLSVIESEKHRQLSVEAAAKSYVLLKNQKTILPFTKVVPKIAVSIIYKLMFKVLFNKRRQTWRIKEAKDRFHKSLRSRRGGDRIVDGFTTTYEISAYPQ